MQMPSAQFEREDRSSLGFVIPGAALQSSFSVGALNGIDEIMSDYDVAPADAIIVSSGSIAGACANVAGQMPQAVTGWIDMGDSDAVSQRSGDPARLPTVDIQAILHRISQVLDVQSVLESRTRVFIVVSDVDKREPAYLEVTSEKGEAYFYEVMEASMSFRKVKKLDGKRYADGDLAGDFMLSTEFARNRLGISNVLAINSATKRGGISFLRKLKRSGDEELYGIVRERLRSSRPPIMPPDVLIQPEDVLPCGMLSRNAGVSETIEEGERRAINNRQLVDLAETLSE